jgi:uncharacterized protein (TIGR03437 family)
LHSTGAKRIRSPGSSVCADTLCSQLTGAPFINASGTTQLRVTALDPTGTEQSHFDFSLGDSPAVAALAVDPQLNVIVAGNMDSGGFLVRFDPALTSILDAVTLPGALIYAMTLDSSGNIYAGGSSGTGAAATPGAYQTGAGGAYLAKLSPTFQVSAATFFGGGNTDIATMALDSSGNIVVAGSTMDDGLPTTPGAYATQCNCGFPFSAGFAAEFSPSLSSLVWSTFVPYPTIFGVNSLALDKTGNVVLVGYSSGFPLSSNALQPVYPGDDGGGLLLELNSTASQLIFATYFGGTAPLTGPIVDPPDAGPVANVNSVSVDASNTIWITGYSTELGLPGPNLGPTYIANVSADGSSLLGLVTAPEGAAGVQILVEPSGTIAALGSQGSVLLSTSSEGPSIVGVTNAAGPAVSPFISPVEIVSIYGYNLGPSTPLSAQVSGGVVSNELGGYSVLFNGLPAPLLYVGPNQIECVVPVNVPVEFSTSFQLVTPEGTLNGPTFSVVQTQPGIFYSGDGYASALNQDGTVNSASNPAPEGSIVSLFATGVASPAHSTDGVVVPPSQILASEPLSVSSYGVPIEVDYSGDAPDQVWGVTQLNIRVPYSGIFGLYIETASDTSSAVLIYASPSASSVPESNPGRRAFHFR